MEALEDGYWGEEVVSEYGGIRQRWLLVYSETAAEREERGLERKQATLEKVRGSFGKFVLATNELDPGPLSAQGMPSHYKEQGVSVERGFRFLKDPVFFAHSLFLKSPAHIMALIMVMIVALLVFSLAERQLRLQLSEENLTVRSQTGKPTESPTMRWVFQMFEGIDLLLILKDDQMVSQQVLNLKPDHLKIIRLLRHKVQNCFQPP